MKQINSGVIYGLIDPRTGEIKYIGKTTIKLNDRLSSHLNLAKKPGKKNLLYSWLRSILDSGNRPIILEIEKTNNLTEREIYWISYYKNFGIKNQQPGGEGQPKGYEFKNRYIPPKGEIPKHFIKYIGNQLGRKRSLDTKIKMSKAQSNVSRPGNWKKIVAKNIETQKEIYFKSLKEASFELNLAVSGICSCLKHRIQTFGVYQFKYENGEYPNIVRPRKNKVYIYKNNEILVVYDSILEASRCLLLDRKLIMRYCKTNTIHNNFKWSYV